MLSKRCHNVSQRWHTAKVTANRTRFLSIAWQDWSCAHSIRCSNFLIMLSIIYTLTFIRINFKHNFIPLLCYILFNQYSYIVSLTHRILRIVTPHHSINYSWLWFLESALNVTWYSTRNSNKILPKAFFWYYDHQIEYFRSVKIWDDPQNAATSLHWLEIWVVTYHA